MTPAERQMSILTLLIFLATAANVWVFYLESEDTSRQMKALTDKAGGITRVPISRLAKFALLKTLGKARF